MAHQLESREKVCGNCQHFHQMVNYAIDRQPPDLPGFLGKCTNTKYNILTTSSGATPKQAADYSGIIFFDNKCFEPREKR